MKYSEQAQLIINNLKVFDKTKFEEWFEKNRIASGGDIIHYLEQ